jgi:sec-independent protein translocase protein TatA
MDILSPLHLLILLGVAVLVFGPRRLPELGKGLGNGIREFRTAIHGPRREGVEAAPLSPDTVVPGEATPAGSAAEKDTSNLEGIA